MSGGGGEVAALGLSAPVNGLTLAELSGWMCDLAAGDWSWVKNGRCKYVTLKIDTRRGTYALLDRDEKPITGGELRWQYSAETPAPPQPTPKD